ncbi:hypothetical protein GVAV_003547 [Gurleya vavrai]
MKILVEKNDKKPKNFGDNSGILQKNFVLTPRSKHNYNKAINKKNLDSTYKEKYKTKKLKNINQRTGKEIQEQDFNCKEIIEPVTQFENTNILSDRFYNDIYNYQILNKPLFYEANINQITDIEYDLFLEKNNYINLCDKILVRSYKEEYVVEKIMFDYTIVDNLFFKDKKPIIQAQTYLTDEKIKKSNME